MYRWILGPSGGRSIYVTLNCPEVDRVAHMVVSDPADAAEPVSSHTLRTAGELDDAVAAILRRCPPA